MQWRIRERRAKCLFAYDITKKMKRNYIIDTIIDNGLIPPASAVIVAVSGGPDSLCLLHALNSIADMYDMVLVPVHVNHMLRPEAYDESMHLADICERRGVLVIADEIHADLTLPGHQHVSYSTVNAVAAHHSITFMAPSKTFNIAGLGSSVCFIRDENLRKRFFGWLDGLGVAGGNIFAFTAAEAAFAQGEEWLQQMLDYLCGNVQALDDFLKTRMPYVKAVLPEASYLAWLDLSAVPTAYHNTHGISHEELKNKLLYDAKVVLNDGTTFGGKDYEHCFRLNLGCPCTMLLDVLERIADALQK